MAAHTVFRMPELFERIYWYNTSFAAITVNKEWNALSRRLFYRNLEFYYADAALKLLHFLYQNPNIQRHARTLKWHHMDKEAAYSPERECFSPSAILVSLLVMVGPTLDSLFVADSNVFSMLVALPIVSSTMTELKHLDIPVPCYNVIVLNYIHNLKNLHTLKLQSASYEVHDCVTGAVGFNPTSWSFDHLTHLRIAGWGFPWSFLQDCTLPECSHISIDDIDLAIQDQVENLRSFLQTKNWKQLDFYTPEGADLTPLLVVIRAQRVTVGWLEPSLDLRWVASIKCLRLQTQRFGPTTASTLKGILTSGYQVDRADSPLLVQLGGDLRDTWESPSTKRAHSLHTLKARLQQHGVLVEVVNA